MDNFYKYYINISWIPINVITKHRYKRNYSQIRRPEIVSICSGFGNKVFEISDVFLFYCDVEGEYEYSVYENDNFRIVKYKLLKDTNTPYKMCIKSNTLKLGFLTNLSELSFSNIISNRKFNSNTFNDIEKVVFVEKQNKYECDMVSFNNVIYLSVGNTNSYIHIGKSSSNFKCKVYVNFDDVLAISIIDIYKLNSEILRKPYLERYQSHNIILEQKYNDNIKITVAPQINLNDIEIDNNTNTNNTNTNNLNNPNNDIIIFDNDTTNYMEWSKKLYANVQIYKNNINLLNGVIEDNFTNQEDTKSAHGEVIRLYANNTFDIDYDSVKLDKYTLLKFF